MYNNHSQSHALCFGGTNRLVNKVKSIVEWTTTGGKNNKEAIEILDKRNRDHFRYQAHKNHTKEKERKEQYSTFRT